MDTAGYCRSRQQVLKVSGEVIEGAVWQVQCGKQVSEMNNDGEDSIITGILGFKQIPEMEI